LINQINWHITFLPYVFSIIRRSFMEENASPYGICTSFNRCDINISFSTAYLIVCKVSVYIRHFKPLCIFAEILD
jgi:hypothetical protein